MFRGWKKPIKMSSRRYRIQICWWFWKMNFESEVCPISSLPTEGMKWIAEIVSAWNMDELKSATSILGRMTPDFKVLDSKIARVLNQLLTADFNRRVYMEEQKAQHHNRFLKGRRVAYMINDNFKISGTGEALLDLNDLRRVLLNNDNVQGFDTKCDEVLRSMTKLPDEEKLDNVCKKQLHFFEGSKPFMALYLQNIVQKGEKASYSRLRGCPAVMLSRKWGTQISMPATNAGLFKEQQPGKETQEEIPKPMHRKRSNIEQMKIVVNGPRKDNVCEEIRAVSSTDVKKKGTEKRRRSRSESETRRHSEEDGKGDIKGNGTKGTSPSWKLSKLVCTHSPEGAMPEGVHMRWLTPTRMPTLQIQKWMQLKGHVCIK